jgi:hypothetical protein
MAMQFSLAVRNGLADQYETIVGTTPTLEIRSGAPPADCAAADTGTVLATVPLPSDWLLAAAGGIKMLSGTWQDGSADATGTAGHFRLRQGATCHTQGTVTATGGGGDMTVQTVSFVATQPFSVTGFAITVGGG